MLLERKIDASTFQSKRERMAFVLTHSVDS